MHHERWWQGFGQKMGCNVLLSWMLGFLVFVYCFSFFVFLFLSMSFYLFWHKMCHLLHDTAVTISAQNFWMTQDEFVCKCPKLKIGKRFLLLGRDDTNDVDHPGIINNKFTIMIEWEESLLDKLERFSRRELKGQCPNRRKLVSTSTI
jgi:hypothetical protein